MIRLWLTFVFLAVVIHFTISTWRSMTGKEKWSLTKTAMYSIMVSLLTLSVLTAIVVIF